MTRDRVIEALVVPQSIPRNQFVKRRSAIVVPVLSTSFPYFTFFFFRSEVQTVNAVNDTSSILYETTLTLLTSIASVALLPSEKCAS